MAHELKRPRLISRPDLVGGDLVFEGTRIPVRHIGLLAKKGVPLAEILEDYPAISASDVAFAREFVDSEPAPARAENPIRFMRLPE